MSPLYLHNIQLSLWWLIRKGKCYCPKSARGLAAIPSLGRDDISFRVDTENDYITFFHCRRIVVWFVTSLCHIIIFLAVLLAASSADNTFYVIHLKNLKGKKMLKTFCFRCRYCLAIDPSIHLSFLDNSLVKTSIQSCSCLFADWFGIVPGFASSGVQNCVMLGQKLSCCCLSLRNKRLSSMEECTLHCTCK